MKYTIEGGQKLAGEITISGNKNAVFPCVAAALLTDQEVTLENIPKISDVEILIEILTKIGVEVNYKDNRLAILAKKISWKLPKDLMVKLRGAMVMAGAVLARENQVEFHYPGGDIIGRRSIEAHLDGFDKLGAKVASKDLVFQIKYDSNKKPETDCNIFMLESSVTGTENLILASVLGTRKITLRNCASEPHVVDLCKMLSQMGAQIHGIGTDTLTITGVSRLSGTRYSIGVDYVEVGTYAVAAAVCCGEISIKGIGAADFEPILQPLSRFGVVYTRAEDIIIFTAKQLHGVDDLKTNIWPGFPTDLMSVAIVLATQAEGFSLCHDWMYESRMFFADKLIAMGARIVIADPHRVLVSGPTPLKGRVLETPDIRAGMALVLAALVAKGTSVIDRAELIERGYEDVVGKLTKLGARIQKSQNII